MMQTSDFLVAMDTYEHFRRIRSKWDESPFHQRLYAHDYYQRVYFSTHVDTGYSTKDAMKLKHPTKDHYISPRMMIRAIMTLRPELLDIPEEFIKYFHICQHTVNVTPNENLGVRFKNTDDDIQISELTIHKYNHTCWFHPSRGLLVDVKTKTPAPFPLTDTIPDFFTQYEQSLLR